MLENTLSVCMIVKDEEKNITRCLESIKDLADEIIIVDTGSTDNTISIAKNYGAKVISFTWNNDFSQARNISLESATKNWILILDADEEIPFEEGIKLKDILKLNENLEAFHLRLVNMISNIDIGDAIVLRLFKNNKNYRFEGNMHEQIVHSITKYSNNSLIGSTDIKIKHYGYDPQFADLEKKQQRNMDLLNSYPKEKRDGYFYYSLGNEYARIDDTEKALECYYKALDLSKNLNATPIYLTYLYLHIIKVLSAAKRYSEELKMINIFKQKFKNFKDLYFMECLAHIECGRYSNAKNSLMNYLNCETGSYEYPCSKFENYYNIQQLLDNLNNTSIYHKENILSVLIIAYENHPKLLDTIKSVSEISDNVVILTKNNSNLDNNYLKNIGVKIVEVKGNNNGKHFLSAYNKCNGDFILLMKPGEFLPLETQSDLIELLSNTNSNYFNLSIIDTQLNSQSSEFRLFENSKYLKKYKTFKEFSDYIYCNEISNAFINIYK